MHRNLFYYDWNSKLDREIFSRRLETLSSEIQCDLFSCWKNCNDPVHRVDIDKINTDIKNIITLASKHMRRDYSSQKFKKIVGWNEYVQGFHNVARTNFLSWIDK